MSRECSPHVLVFEINDLEIIRFSNVFGARCWRRTPVDSMALTLCNESQMCVIGFYLPHAYCHPSLHLPAAFYAAPLVFATENSFNDEEIPPLIIRTSLTN